MNHKVFITILIITGSIFFTNCQQGDVNPLKLQKGPHLFVDDYLIAEQSFLNRTVNHPEKLSEPILKGGKENDWVFQPYISVLQDDETGRFRMWYNTPVDSEVTHECHIGYMESDDGINWIRPFRLLEDPHEIQFGVSVIDQGKNYPNPNERYLFATYLKPGLRISTSPDGLIWTSISDEPVLIHNHDISSLHWDPIREHYFAIVSHRIGGFADPRDATWDDNRRITHQSISKDFKNWEEIWPIIEPKMGAPIEVGETQFYAMSGVITRGDLMIGLVKVLRDDLNATYGKTGNEMGDMNRKAAGIGYTVLAWTRDGVTWQRDHEPFLDRNPVPGTFDHAMAWGDEQIIVDNKTYIYYGGYERGHKIERFYERHIGFASILKDRYVSREADFNPGKLITKPFLLEAEGMTLNANIKGEIKIRLLNEDYSPLEGYGWIAISGNEVDLPVNWETGLNNLKNKTVRLEFSIKDAQLFGFELN